MKAELVNCVAGRFGLQRVSIPSSRFHIETNQRKQVEAKSGGKATLSNPPVVAKTGESVKQGQEVRVGREEIVGRSGMNNIPIYTWTSLLDSYTQQRKALNLSIYKKQFEQALEYICKNHTSKFRCDYIDTYLLSIVKECTNKYVLRHKYNLAFSFLKDRSNHKQLIIKDDREVYNPKIDSDSTFIAGYLSFLKDKQDANCSRSLLRTYSSTLKPILLLFEREEIQDELDILGIFHRIKDYVVSSENGYTQRLRRSVLHNYFLSIDFVEISKKIKKISVAKEEIKSIYIDPKKLFKAIENAKTAQDRTYLILCGIGGLRKSEVNTATRSKGHACGILVRGKGSKNGIVIIPKKYFKQIDFDSVRNLTTTKKVSIISRYFNGQNKNSPS